jgi:hypothetical protein
MEDTECPPVTWRNTACNTWLPNVNVTHALHVHVRSVLLTLLLRRDMNVSDDLYLLPNLLRYRSVHDRPWRMNDTIP